MKIKALSILSVLLAAIAISQAAPTAAEAPETVLYDGVNPKNPNDTISGHALNLKETTHHKVSSSLECWNSLYNGRTYEITCSGSSWYIWVDCNRRRYTAGPISGAYRAWIICPKKTSARKGGAYGY